MATNYYNIPGFIKWAKVYTPDEYLGVKRWTINFYPKDALAMKRFMEMGTELKKQKDEDGEFFRLRRPVNKLIGDNLVVFAPPKITGLVEVKYEDQEGNELRSHNKGDGKEIIRNGDEILLGNLTEVVVNICVYSTQKGKGHRLESIKVTKLVQFTQSEDQVDDPLSEVEEKVKPEEKVEQLKGAKLVTSETALKEELNDEIPW